MASGQNTTQFSAEQCREIADQYWRDKSAFCPICKSALTLTENYRTTGRIAVAFCQRCGASAENF